MSDELKALKTAKLCLRKAVKEKDEKRRNALMYQFCLQMKKYCVLMAERSENAIARRVLRSDARIFGAFAKLCRSLKR